MVLAGWESLVAEGYVGRAIWQSTTGTAPFLIVNGPVRERLGLNSTGNVFGSGFRANATIGRAIRLGAINAFGLRPHELDQATQGTPAKYTACIAENEEQSPWPALHEEFGLAAADSAVTAMVIRSCVHIEARHTMVPEQLAADLAGTIARTGALIHETISAALVLSPEHARLFAAAGWSKADVRQAVYERAVLSWPELVAAGKDAVSSRTRWRLPADHPDALPGPDSGSLHVLTSPEAVLVVVAGAGNAGVSAVVETFGPRGGPPPVVRVRSLGQLVRDRHGDRADAALLHRADHSLDTVLRRLVADRHPLRDRHLNPASKGRDTESRDMKSRGRYVSTGHLPSPRQVQAAVDESYEMYRSETSGENSQTYPALARVPGDLFGICVAGINGSFYRAGDTGHEFTIMSVAKPFVFALVCDVLGDEHVRQEIGVNATGLAFDSVAAAERSPDGRSNPMVNAGAIAAVSLVPGESSAAKWLFIREGMSRFAGRDLAFSDEVYASAATTNHRNRAIANYLASRGRIYSDPVEAIDLYTRQSCLLTSAEDLAVMSATLADGGINPVTGRRVVTPAVCQHALAVMATAGMYQTSGDWLFDVGVPGKSGIAGGIVAVSPGKGGLGTFSPLLDRAGNSVRGQLVARHLSRTLGLSLFASKAQRSTPPAT